MQPTNLLMLGDERFYQHLPFQFNQSLLKAAIKAVIPKLKEDWVVQVIHTEKAVLQIKFIEAFRISSCLNPNYHPVPLSKQIKDAWQAYTQEATLQTFQQLPVDFETSPSGLVNDVPYATPFQRAVWHQLQSLPVGTTSTYGQLALAVNKPIEASRAVGGALAKNPVPLIIPCHRVIPKSGASTNFCGSPKLMEIKEFLLAWEVFQSET